MTIQRILNFLYEETISDLDNYNDLCTNDIIIKGGYDLTLLDILCLNVHDNTIFWVGMEDATNECHKNNVKSLPPPFRFVLEKIEWMLESPSVDVNFQGDRGWTILHRAASVSNPIFGNSSISVIKLLLSKGADPNLRVQGGHTILMGTVQNCEPDHGSSTIETVECLLDAGADINAQNDNGYTAIMNACMFSTPKFYNMSCPEVIDLLLKRGADTTIVAATGCTAYVLLREFNQCVIGYLKNIHMMYGYYSVEDK